MKKKVFVTLISMLFALSLCACGEEVTESTQAQETEMIAVTVDATAVNMTELSKAELLALTPEEIQKSIETYLPDYRSVYGIAEDYVMTDEDWSILRDAICLEIYGSLSQETEVQVMDDFSDDPNAIYYAPSIASLEAMDTTSFALYMNNMNLYYGGSAEVDFTQESEEFLEQTRQDLIAQLKITYAEAGIAEEDTVPVEAPQQEETANDTEN